MTNVFLTEGDGGAFLTEGDGGDFLLEGEVTDPIKLPIPVGQWIKVAANVTSGTLWPLKKSAIYIQTIRDAGNPAPSNDDFSEGVILPYPDGALIASPIARDIYVAVAGQDVDRDAGEIRVDLP